jgi:hypothetical protein
MPRTVLALLLIGAFGGPRDSSGPGQLSPQVVKEPFADPSRAQSLNRWPNGVDLARFQSVEGKPKAVVLEILGHPSRVERRPDGEEVWDYPWLAACRVSIRKGVCFGTFYTAGY